MIYKRKRASGDSRQKAAENKLLLRYSRGEVTREQVLETLNIDYFQLLDLLEERQISRPRVPDDLAERMSNDMVKLFGKG